MGLWKRNPEKSIDALHKRHPQVPRDVISDDYRAFSRGSLGYQIQLTAGKSEWEYWADITSTVINDERPRLRELFDLIFDCPLALR